MSETGWPARLIRRAVDAREGERPGRHRLRAVLLPVRRLFHAAADPRDHGHRGGGCDKLQWLFTATFVTMLLAVPLFGALSAAGVARRPCCRGCYLVVFVANLLAFAAGFSRDAGSICWRGGV